ncbi:AI-2E family transporter [Tengunoibacter tsumagoiensis]|uniref:AI-2E family transporter n=1 Tax=Tengunoibacter tsumagoiensis TaxID=2014871 RepID=A0A402A640_9CHLR|nr:AI-2E family transporter [Tengunoibacter tsumagoiensis]GCE14475.1 AI-2E family transporter [Tengunoibacter tsumagoiensis]
MYSSLPRPETATTKWARRRDMPIAILAWIAVAFVILWGAAHIVRTILILVIAALLAYALAPAVKLLQRFMPRFLAILIMYLLVLGAISFLVYIIINTAIDQVGALSHTIQNLLTPGKGSQVSPIEQRLNSWGVSSQQIASVRTQLTNSLEGGANTAVPFLKGAFDTVLDIVLVAVLSIYLLIDGLHVSNWLRQNAPQLARIDFLIDTIQRVVGGYIRGQFLLAVLVGVLVGGGMFAFHVPYAVLLGVLAFVLEFIPVLGTLISGAICVLIALTQGWLIAVLVLIYFVVMHVLEGDVIGPRIVGKAIGLHPIVSLAALVAGSELFGIWGALFASPVAGVIQAFIIALWINWHSNHPEHFEPIELENAETKVESIVDQSLGTSQS